MNRLLILVAALVLAAPAQTFKGNITVKGNTASAVFSGGPLTYLARTDNCVTGAESGCIGGRTTGQAGSPMSFMYRTTDPVPFANLAPANTAGTDPDFNAYIVMATDTSLGPNHNTQFTTGDSGVNTLFNKNTTLFTVKTTGNAAYIYQVNPSLIHSRGCSPATPCTLKSQIKTGSINVNSFTTNTGCTASCALTFTTAAQTLANGQTVTLTSFAPLNGALDGQSGIISSVDSTHFTLTVAGTSGGYTSGSGLATDSAHLISQAAWTWSRVSGETNVLLELSPNGLQVFKDSINISGDPSTWTLSRAIYVNFASDTPVGCGVAPLNYNSSNTTTLFSSANDGSLNHGIAGGRDWQANWTPTATETFIRPSVGNAGHKGFQAVSVTGATGGTEPTWSASCNTTGSTCPLDGGVTWVNIGTVNVQGDPFDVFSYQPGTGCTYVNTLIGKIYRGTGNSQPAGNWTTDDDITCARLGQTAPCSIDDHMQLHESSQTFDPTYALLSAGGGTACAVPGKCSCSESNSNYLGAWNSATTYAIHDLVFYNTAWYQSKTAHQNSSAPDIDTTDWKADDVYCYTYVWQKATTTIRPCIEIGSGGRDTCDGHSEKGYDSIYAGGKLFSHLYSKPVIGGMANPGVQILPTALPGDYHSAWQQVGPGDQQPMYLANTDIPTSTANYTAAPYAEEALMSTDGKQTLFRIAHNDNTGSEASFGQNAIAGISQDGTIAALETSMMGTRGSASADWAASHAYALGDSIFPLTGNSANVEFIATTPGTSGTGGAQPNWATCTTTCTDNGVTWTNTNKSCNNLRAFFAPGKSTHFNSGDTVIPVTNNTGYDIYEALTTGTTGASVPNWNTGCPNYGDQCNGDGGVNWKNDGPNTCRIDIVLIDLLSAHPLP